jgi:3-methyladenine DNA glycosylase/8-oxoguanine DNA glycosylase
MPDAVSLDVEYGIELQPAPPFHFDATMHQPDHFPAADNDWVPGMRRQTMRWCRVPLGLRFEALGTVDQPRLSVTVRSAHALEPAFLDDLAGEIGYRYNLDLDLAPFYARFSDDRLLGPAIERRRGMRPVTHVSLYEYLIVAILLQNATVRRSVNMMHALFQAYGTLLAYDGRGLYCFWEPEALAETSEEALRRLKVGYRAKSIVRVTEAFARGHVDEFALRQVGAEARRQALLELYGIGPASVGYILFDVFHQWDELNHISPWEQRIYSKLFFDRDPDDPVPVDRLLQHLYERFGKFKMLAVHYIWEDLFWKRTHEQIAWLEKLIRL